MVLYLLISSFRITTSVDFVKTTAQMSDTGNNTFYLMNLINTCSIGIMVIYSKFSIMLNPMSIHEH